MFTNLCYTKYIIQVPYGMSSRGFSSKITRHLNMEAKYILVALMLCQSMALSHILTKAHVELSLPACMKSLASTVMKELCPIYSELSSELYSDTSLAPREQLELRERMLKRCCSMPCTLTDLIYMC
ncbi:hypothetical protein K1T71_006245 [Dendrolimus kikuchii]|uniref:Uncharacterized protein n=1 Tax=Dendrolimus kikuchii TaxID=765133 RepID=A0ACC1D4H8_9NEOP|nr:hypothetical protein K1T71_006245 [Dendrolimus kikuchii]